MKRILLITLLVTATLNAQALDFGKYTYNDGADTLVGVYPADTVSVETTQQLGMEGSKDVPFPTICRFRIWGKLVNEDEESFVVQQKIMELRDSSNLPHSEACGNFVRDFNAAFSSGHVSGTASYSKQALTKITN